MQLALRKDFPITPARLRDMAATRASKDAEHTPWKPGEAHELETGCDTAPVVPIDLQRVAARRITDIQHDVIHHEFSQGLTLKNLPNEREVQKWVANELNSRKRRAYSVERESHVADENEPDIRLRTKAADASLPIEVKVAESWTLRDLEDALVKQLGARYLRDQDANHGVLLLVHQKHRSVGWHDDQGKVLTFPEVVANLEQMAERISGQSPTAPQPVIAVIDVSKVKALTKPKDKKKKSVKKPRGRLLKKPKTTKRK